MSSELGERRAFSEAGSPASIPAGTITEALPSVSLIWLSIV
jgi:hypothetical protein